MDDLILRLDKLEKQIDEVISTLALYRIYEEVDYTALNRIKHKVQGAKKIVIHLTHINCLESIPEN